MMMTKNAYCVFDPPSAALVVPGLGTVARREMCRLFTAGPGSNSLSRKRLLYSAGGPTQASDDDSGHSVPLTIGREGVGAPGELAEIRRCKSSMAKVVTRPCHSPSRAVAPARGRAKRRQGRMWVGLLSDEMFIVRSAEAVSLVEGNTARTATVRSGRAPRRLRTHARMYDRGRDLGGLPVATAHSAAVAKVEAVAERRTNGGEESDQGIVVTKLANKARGAAWRSRWRCAKLTGQVQEVEVLCDEGNNRSTSLPEPCGRSREGTGEASAGVHAGGAIEQRKTHDSEC